MPEEGNSREAGWARLFLLLLKGVVGVDVVVVVWCAVADILLGGGFPWCSDTIWV